MRAADEAALRCDPGNGDAWYGVGLATLMLNDTLYDDASLACFERAVACEPARPLSPTTAPEGARAGRAREPVARARRTPRSARRSRPCAATSARARAVRRGARARARGRAAVHYARAIVLGPSLGRWAEAKDAMRARPARPAGRGRLSAVLRGAPVKMQRGRTAARSRATRAGRLDGPRASAPLPGPPLGTRAGARGCTWRVRDRASTPGMAEARAALRIRGTRLSCRGQCRARRAAAAVRSPPPRAGGARDLTDARPPAAAEILCQLLWSISRSQTNLPENYDVLDPVTFLEVDPLGPSRGWRGSPSGEAGK